MVLPKAMFTLHVQKHMEDKIQCMGMGKNKIQILCKMNEEGN